MDIDDLAQVFRERADGASTRGPDIDVLLGKGKTRRRRRRALAGVMATAIIGAAVTIPVLVAGGSDSSNGPATLVPAASSPPAPTPTKPSIPLPSCPPAYGCPSPAPSPPFPSTPADLASPQLTYQPGISDNGPQISSTRWQNVNSWTTKVETAPYLSSYPLLTIYAGGSTVDHSLQHSSATLAAVLVITPMDIYRVGHNQEFIGMEGTIYHPSPDPQGQLKVISANGNILTLNLVGTSQNYVFNAATNTFQ